MTPKYDTEIYRQNIMTTMIVKKPFNAAIKSIYVTSKVTNTVNEWSNHDNQTFYAHVTAKDLIALANKVGLDSGCDVELLKPYWEHAHSILDVGSGYGRVIKALLKNGFEGEITAIERSPSLVKHLKKYYGNQIELLQMDIQNCFSIHEQFDVIFFLWSGLADFAQSEQSQIIWQLAQLLAPGGRLIVDTMPDNITPIQTVPFDKKSYQISMNNYSANFYIPSAREIENYSITAGLNNFSAINFKTDIGRDRSAFVLS